MDDIKEILDDIIRKRAGKAEDKGRQEKELIRKRESLIRLRELYPFISKLDAGEQELMCGSKEMAAHLQNSQELVAKCLEAFQSAVQSVNRLKIRFQRPTIDLAVIGKIGAGKSRFLQSASGLDDNCIPSLKGESCTGVSSVIENIEDEERTEAHFIFKTEEEVIADINRELESLADKVSELQGTEKPFISPIIKLDSREIQTGFEALAKAAGMAAEKSLGIGQTKAEKLQRMAIEKMGEYTQEDKRKEWIPYVGSSETENEKLKEKGLQSYKDENGKFRYVLSKPEEIRFFVSKHGDSGKAYYRYIAVKEAVIKTHITGIDARVRLVDTVGIGDPAADTVSRVQEAARKESDGVIFISPHRERIATKAGLDDEDMKFLQSLREIFLEHRKADARYWMAFLQNHKKDLEDPKDREFSYEYLKIIEESYKGANDMFGENGICFRRVSDVSSQAEVNVILKDFLRQIAEHLDLVDERLEAEAKELLRKAREQEQKLRAMLGLIRVNTPKKLSQNHIYTLVNSRLECLGKGLKAYRLSLVEEGKKDQGKPSFMVQRIDMVKKLRDGENLEEVPFGLDLLINNCCEREIYIADARLSAVKELKKAVRRIATFPWEKQREMETDYKKKIAHIVIDSLQIDLEMMARNDIAFLDEDHPEFFGKIGEILFDGICDAVEIKEIFDSMNRFRIDEMNALTKALFYHHAEKCLTDEPYKEHIITNNAYGNHTHGNHAEAKQGTARNLRETWRSFQQEETKECHISEEDKRMLKEELKGMLNTFIQAVEADTGQEEYLVGYYDQMNEELYNFMQLLNKEYRERWHMAFCEMKEKEILAKDRKSEERWEVLADVSEKVNSYFSDGGLIGNYEG